jgi:hypothetical protein
MRTNPFRTTNLVALLPLSYLAQLKVFPPLFLREFVPQLWSHLKQHRLSGLSDTEDTQTQTFRNGQSDCLVCGPIIRVYLVVKYLSISQFNWT